MIKKKFKHKINAMEQEQTNTPEESLSHNVEGRDIAIIAYITIIGLIIAFIMNREKQYQFANYHIKQMIGLAIIGLIVFIIGQIPILGWIVSILAFIPLLILWLIGLMNAVNGKEKPIPLVGNLFSDLLKNI